ncbi:MFS transporter [Nocardioides sp. CER19]|uniref:MFS transporter n=1 Tax=Nocardioides sp. CER19 TaxID=3038538 RepID=UPI00244C6C4C|nr:MFS transporter [Nocardioides sp. CER19]MDH2416364.1 MFS transporter [Nocardioides sp. CER19]
MRGLVSRHPFGCWLAAATLSTLGDSVSFFALGWVASGLGAGAVGLVLTIESVPLAALVLVGGITADRYGVRQVMCACDLVMGVVMAALAVGSVGGTPLWGLAVVGFVSGCAAALRRPAEGVFPRLFGSQGLDRRLATVGSFSQVARLAGPAVGGVLVGALGLSGAAALDAASYLLVLFTLLSVRPPHAELAAGRTDGVSPWRRVTAAVRTATATGGVPATLLTIVGLAATALPLVMVALPLTGRDRGWDAGTTGLVSSGWIAGGLLVTVVVARRGAPPAALSVAGPVLASAGVVVLAATERPATAVAAMALVGVGCGLLTAGLLPSFVARTPADMLARFQSLLQLAQVGPVLLATPAVGWLCGALGVRTGLVAIAVVLAATALAARRAVTVPQLAPVTG